MTLGRMQKRILYALGAVLMLSLAAGVWLANSSWLSEKALAWVKDYAHRELGTVVEVKTLRLRPFSGGVVADGIRLSAALPEAVPPFLEIDKFELGVSWKMFVDRGLHLRELKAANPRVNIQIAKDGRSNLPEAKQDSAGGNPIDDVLNLRLGKLDLSGGTLTWNDESSEFSVRGEDVAFQSEYLPASRAYRGQLTGKVGELLVAQQRAAGLLLGLDFTLDRERLEVLKLRAETEGNGQRSWLEAKGTVLHLAAGDEPLRAELSVESLITALEAKKYVPLPVENQAQVLYTGQFLYVAGRGPELHGKLEAANLVYRDQTTRIGPLTATAALDVMPSRLTVTDLRSSAFGGRIQGAFRWDQQEGWQLNSEIAGLDVEQVSRAAGLGPLPWQAVFAGKLRAEAKINRRGALAPMQVELEGNLAPGRESEPVRGRFALAYDDGARSLEAKYGELDLPHSSLKVAGNLSSGLRFQLNTTDLADWNPLLKWAELAPEDYPVALRNGKIQVQGVATGTVGNPVVEAAVGVQSALVGEYLLDSLNGQVTYSPTQLRVARLSAQAYGAEVQGNGQLALAEGKPVETSALGGSLNLRAANLETIVRRLAPEVDLTGSAAAEITLGGTYANPQLNGALNAPRLTYQGETVQNFSAKLSAGLRSLTIEQARGLLSQHPVAFSAKLDAANQDWSSGRGVASVESDRLPLFALANYRKLGVELDGQITSNLNSSFTWSPGGFGLNSLAGRISLGDITRFRRPIGRLDFTARTTGSRAAFTVQGNVKNQPVRGDANIILGKDLPSEFRLQLPDLDFPTIAQLLSRDVFDGPLPYVGRAAASIYFQGPLMETSQWEGTLTIPQLSLAPNSEYVKETLPQVKDVILRNEEPIVFRLSKGVISARETRFLAKDTSFTASFDYRLDNQTISGRTNGTVNLAVISTLQPELITTGTARVEATLGGKLDDPRLNGRLAFNDASFYLRGFSSGMDKIRGSILFDQSRATIESFKAQAGGGNLDLSGFIGIGSTFTYRLQANAERVRIRYPEGVSTTANAALALTGTTERSILTGTISVARIAVGQLDPSQFAASSGVADAGTSTGNPFLDNMQFDVRINTAANAEFTTTLTNDLKGEIALRLRGGPKEPVVLGRVTLTQGEIDFFGGRYTISQGELRFENPLRLDPVINLDLETRVRGVVVNMTFSGQANKLNLTYRSDPPLQSQEIIALLTVGRNPNATGTTLNQVPQQTNQGMLGNDASNMLLGAAVSAGINGRLQRFFGISRVRLDPQLTGIDNVPQARLTLEQQVSRDVTLTYITNLNRTQQQIVRVDWDISRAWTIVAIRDENGLFGLDFFFRKRLQ